MEGIKVNVNVQQLGTWDRETQWGTIIEYTKAAARMTDEETARLEKSAGAELVAATAYISNCIDPDRIAVSHLITYIGGVRCRALSNYRTGESTAQRLTAFDYFPGGNSDAVKAGMLLLELLSLNDHKADIYEDIINGKQNPLIVDMDFEQEKERVLADYRALPENIQMSFKRLKANAIVQLDWIP